MTPEFSRRLAQRSAPENQVGYLHHTKKLDLHIVQVYIRDLSKCTLLSEVLTFSLAALPPADGNPVSLIAAPEL